MERRGLPRVTSCILGLVVISINFNVICSLALRGLKASNNKRQANPRAVSGKLLECIQMESFPGDYWYQSPGTAKVCGLFLIGSPDQLFEVEFTGFDISCEDGGLLATLDGWETQGQIFPGGEDHELSLHERYRTYCGDNAPTQTFVTSQNVGLIQFRIPKAGDGFRVTVRSIPNVRPCNAISMDSDGVYTVANFGQKKNCSVSFLYPETISIVNLNVGETLEAPTLIRETGGMMKCSNRGERDRMELLGGEGLDPKFMALHVDFCGLDTNAVDLQKAHVACSHTVVRLVSSGHYYNSVTFMHNGLTSTEQSDGHVFTECFSQY